MHDYDKKRSKSFSKEMNKIFSGIIKVGENLKKIASNTASSRLTILNKDNTNFAKKLSSVKSTISLK